MAALPRLTEIEYKLEMKTKFGFWKPKNAQAIDSEYRKDFRQTTKNGFDLHLLPTDDAISEQEFVQAALETGYGPQHAWPIDFFMDSGERNDLGRFLGQRAQSVVSMFDFREGRIHPKLFSKYLESSEWSAISYMVGQIGASIGIARWLGPHRLPMQVLHKSVYANASFVRDKVDTVPRKPKIKLVPDLLVKDRMSAWHFLEAKGGKANYTLRAVNKGLAQVEAHDLVVASGASNPPLSRVCSFVHIDRPTKMSKPLRFDLIDPDGPQDQSELIVFDDLATAMSRLLVESTLNGLPEASKDRSPPGATAGFRWRETGSQNVLVAVPEPTAASIELSLRVALMLAMGRRIAQFRRPRFPNPRQVADEIVSEAAVAVQGRRDPVTSQEAKNLSDLVEASLNEEPRGRMSVVSALTSLGESLELHRDLDADALIGRVKTAEQGGLSGAVAGRSGAVYVSASRPLQS